MNKILELIEEETNRQRNELCLIASENITSRAVNKAVGSILTNKYCEGYPEHRYYSGCDVVDKIEQYAIDKAKQLFKCSYANVQPHSGSQANQAVYNALLKPGDTVLSMSLDAGGHLTHGAKVSSSGHLYNIVHYGLDENGFIDYKDIEEKLHKHNPKLLVVGASAYSRIIDFERIKEIVDLHNCALIDSQYPDLGFDTLYNTEMSPERIREKFDEGLQIKQCLYMVDMAHIAGLVAANILPPTAERIPGGKPNLYSTYNFRIFHPSPIPYADVVTSTTHKTLRGPRGGLILTNNEEIAKKINKSVFPGIQGGPLMHVIAGKAVCFEEALQPEFKEYQEQVLKNIKAMEDVFKRNNVNMLSGGSDNHLILLDLKETKVSGKLLEECLEKIGIIVNKNAVVNDPRSKVETSGIRIGTANITTRGATEEDCRILAEVISSYIQELNLFGGIPDSLYSTCKTFIVEILRKKEIQDKTKELLENSEEELMDMLSFFRENYHLYNVDSKEDMTQEEIDFELKVKQILGEKNAGRNRRNRRN